MATPTSTDLTGYKVIIVVFAMPGCGACEEYIPRFQQQVIPYQKVGIPVFIYDASSENANLQAMADRYKVRYMPTTLVLPRGPGYLKAEGALDTHGLEQLLRRAYGVHTGASQINPY